MVTHDSTSTSPAPQLRPAELQALAARLRARANSVLMKDQPHRRPPSSSNSPTSPQRS